MCIRDSLHLLQSTTEVICHTVRSFKIYETKLQYSHKSKQVYLSILYVYRTDIATYIFFLFCFCYSTRQALNNLSGEFRFSYLCLIRSISFSAIVKLANMMNRNKRESLKSHAKEVLECLLMSKADICFHFYHCNK